MVTAPANRHQGTIVAALCWPASYVHLPKLRGRGEGMEETDKDVALTLWNFHRLVDWFQKQHTTVLSHEIPVC